MGYIKEAVLAVEIFMAPYLYVACRLVFGTLYPAYASYKAVRTKNVKEYVKWMMYWIVFALFTTVETFSDVLLSWVPFYYELKMLFVLWMLTPYTRGSNFLYRKVVHPQLVKREKDIDDMIAQASKQGYATLLTLGTKGLNYATNVIARTALRGHGHIVDHLRRSYSTSDISMSEDGSGLAIQRREQYEEEEGSEDELDNRLREDNEEIARRAQPARIKKSHTNPGLSSVKEEEEEEVVTSEEVIYLPAPSKKKYTTKEQKQISTYGTMPRSSRSSRTRTSATTTTTASRRPPHV